MFTDHFLGLSSESHLRAASRRFWLLADMLKHATVRSFSADKSRRAITYFSESAPSRSFLLPNAKRGIPARLLFASSSCSCARARSILAGLVRGTLVVGIDYEDDHIRVSAEFLP